MAIAEVSVTAVRGIRQRVTLSLKGKSLALRGDNGTGKSSFVAALRWAVRGEKTVGQEDAKTAAEFWHHRLEAADAPSVTVTLRGGGTIEINSTGVRADEAGDRFRLACMRANPFLPRRQLLKFLEDKPGERFQYLESFLDLEQADEIHEVFAGLVSSSQEAMGVAARQRDLLVTRCLAHVPNDRHAGAKSWNTLLAVLRQWATELSIAPGDTFEGLRDAVAGLRKLIDGDDLGRLRERLDRHRATLLALTSTPQPADPAVALERRRQLEAAASDAALADLLKLAADHFDSHPADEKCPVCTQSVDAMKVLSNLKVRGEALRELREVRSGLAALGREWVALLTQVREAIVAFHLTVGGEPRFPPFLATAPAAEELLDRVDGTAAAILSEIELFIEALLGRADDELAKLPDTASVPSLRALVAAIDAAGEAQLAMSIAESTVDAASRRHHETKAIAEALRRARQDVARTLLDDISKYVANYYRVIHPPSEPDEATGAPSIEVQRHKAGTAHVRGEFAQRRVEDPRLVYSDGHLDTVGICVFLALRRFRATRDTATDPKLIVLDDIVLSVDLGHARRLLDLLDAEFDDHQVLIFTHNGAFFEWWGTCNGSWAN